MESRKGNKRKGEGRKAQRRGGKRIKARRKGNIRKERRREGGRQSVSDNLVGKIRNGGHSGGSKRSFLP